jgi:hypothetical protein
VFSGLDRFDSHRRKSRAVRVNADGVSRVTDPLSNRAAGRGYILDLYFQHDVILKGDA